MECKNHPEITARRRCFECKAPICPACQLKEHHHIFCSQKCSDRWLESQNSEETEISQKLNLFDQSINEDLKDFGDYLGDGLHRDFSDLEDRLDKALTTIATMVEGSGNAISTEFKAAQMEWSPQFGHIQRTLDDRTDRLENTIAGVKQVTVDGRERLVDLKEQLERIYRNHLEQVRSISERMARLQDETLPSQFQGLTQNLEEENQRLQNKIQEGQRRIEDLERNLQSLIEETKQVVRDEKEELAQEQEKSRELVSEGLQNLANDHESTRLRLSEAFEKLENSLKDRVKEQKEEFDSLVSGLRLNRENSIEVAESTKETVDQKSQVLLEEMKNSFLGLSEALQKQFEAAGNELKEKAAFLGTEIHISEKKVSDQAEHLSKERSKELLEYGAKIDSSLALERRQLSNDLAEFREQQVKEIEALGEDLRELLDKAYSNLDSQAKEQERLSEGARQAIRESLDNFSTHVRDQVSRELKRVIDDFATLSVAQRANWEEVVYAAKAGAVKEVKNVRGEALDRLKKEVEALAKEQSRWLGESIQEVKEELRKRIRGEVPKWKMGLAYSGMALGLAALVAFPLMFFSGQSGSHRAEVSEQLAHYDESMQAWVEERLQEVSQEATRQTSPILTAFPSLTRGSLNRKELAVTFDGGSGASVALDILKTLKDFGIQTTFFLTGDFIQNFPEVTRRIAQDGHEAANHMLKHDQLVDTKTRKSLISKKELFRQLLKVEELYQEATGTEMKRFWRAPYGEINRELIRWAATLGYRHVGWTRSGRMSLDTLDWVADKKSSLYRSSDEILKRIWDFEKKDSHGLNGGVVLMHLGSHRNSDFPHEKLPELLSTLKAKKYRTVPLSMLLRAEVAQN